MKGCRPKPVHSSASFCSSDSMLGSGRIPSLGTLMATSMFQSEWRQRNTSPKVPLPSRRTTGYTPARRSPGLRPNSRQSCMRAPMANLRSLLEQNSSASTVALRHPIRAVISAPLDLKGVRSIGAPFDLDAFPVVGNVLAHLRKTSGSSRDLQCVMIDDPFVRLNGCDLIT